MFFGSFLSSKPAHFPFFLLKLQHCFRAQIKTGVKLSSPNCWWWLLAQVWKSQGYHLTTRTYLAALWLGQPMLIWVPKPYCSHPGTSLSQELGLLLAALFILNVVFSLGCKLPINAKCAVGSCYHGWRWMTTSCSWAGLYCWALFPCGVLATHLVAALREPLRPLPT